MREGDLRQYEVSAIGGTLGGRSYVLPIPNGNVATVSIYPEAHVIYALLTYASDTRNLIHSFFPTRDTDQTVPIHVLANRRGKRESMV